LREPVGAPPILLPLLTADIYEDEAPEVGPAA